MQPLAINPLIRSDAIRALGKIGNEEAIPLLLILLIRGEKELASYGMPYYIYAAEALGNIGKADARVMQALARGARLPGGSDKAEKIRLAADSALRQIQKAQEEINASNTNEDMDERR
jgi:HEAT repeat protein